MSLPSACVRTIRPRLALLALCGLWGWMAPARADIYDSTNTIFNVTGQFASGSTLSGTLTLNPGSVFDGNIALFSAADLTLSGPDNLHLTNVISQEIFTQGLTGDRYYSLDVGSSANSQAVFYLPTTFVNSQEFAGYSGGPIAPAIGLGSYSAAYSAAGGFGRDLLTSGFVGTGPASSCSSLIAGAVHPVPGGDPSGSGMPSSMTATFSPNGTTIAQAATACGVETFDWTQRITALPG